MATQSSNGIRFPIQPVSPKQWNSGNLNEQNFIKSWETVGKVEAMSPILPNTVMTFDKHNMLARAVHEAFYNHYSLRLSPDVIWITIAQGFANHVNHNAEKLRSKFVSFEGKKELEIQRDDFVRGSPNNDWPGVFPEFCDKIEEYIGEKTRKLLEADFSTTELVERTVSQIVLMDAVKSYFNYAVGKGCGIPFIELTGVPEDWINIRARVATFRNFELGWWVDALLPVLDQFVSASQGDHDTAFWTSICNLYGGSGHRRPITGWIQVFFPYLGNGKQNLYLNAYRECMENKTQNKLKDMSTGVEGCGRGVRIQEIPGGISKVPFVFKDLNQSYNMSFCGGITCCVFDKNAGVLEPKIGWAILYDDSKTKNN